MILMPKYASVIIELSSITKLFKCQCKKALYYEIKHYFGAMQQELPELHTCNNTVLEQYILHKPCFFKTVYSTGSQNIFCAANINSIPDKKADLSILFAFVTNMLLPSFFPLLSINTCVSPLYKEEKFLFSVSVSGESKLKALFFFFFTSPNTTALQRCC